MARFRYDYCHTNCDLADNSLVSGRVCPAKEPMEQQESLQRSGGFLHHRHYGAGGGRSRGAAACCHSLTRLLRQGKCCPVILLRHNITGMGVVCGARVGQVSGWERFIWKMLS